MLRGQDIASQEAALAPRSVQLKQESSAPRVDTPVQRHERPGRAVQRMTRAVQREGDGQTPSDTPATTPPAPTFTGPRTYAQYTAHLRATYAGQLAAMATAAQTLKSKGGDAARLEQQLVPDLEKLAQKKQEYLDTKDQLDAEKRKKLEAQVGALQGAADNAGATMPQLLERAKALVAQIQSGGQADITLKNQLEGVMQASMALAVQIDPEGTGQGRELYNTIDKTENPKLLSDAAAGNVPTAEQAQLAVDYRNWLRQFFRDEVMVDQNSAEILYLRDLGISGQREGLTLAQVMDKIIAKLKKEKDKETGQAVLRGDFTLQTATPQELDAIYAGVMGSARTTNAGVNTTATGNAEGSGNRNTTQ